MGDTTKQRFSCYVTVGSTTYQTGQEVPADLVGKLRAGLVVADDGAEVDVVKGAVTTVGTACGARLAATVHVGGRAYGPDDVVPDDVAAQIRNPKAWVNRQLPKPVVDQAAEQGTDTPDAEVVAQAPAESPAPVEVVDHPASMVIAQPVEPRTRRPRVTRT